MQLTVERDNLVQLYGWSIPYAWLPKSLHGNLHFRLSFVLLLKFIFLFYKKRGLFDL